MADNIELGIGQQPMQFSHDGHGDEGAAVRAIAAAMAAANTRLIRFLT